MQSSSFKGAVAKNSAIERAIKSFAKLLAGCDEVDFGVFSTATGYSSATDDERARDIFSMAAVVNSAYALTPVHRVNTTSDDELSVVRVEKVHCAKCGFFVNSLGHEDRCEVRALNPHWMKTIAWLGDSLLGMHVRVLLVTTVGLDGGRFQMYTSNVALSSFYELVSTSFLGSEFSPSGSSSHSRGTVVEAAYALSFEYRYRLLEHFDISEKFSTVYMDAAVSQPIYQLMSTGNLTVIPNVYVFGYCYMCMLPEDLAYSFAKTSGPFITYGKIKAFLAGSKIRKKWYVSHQFDNVYHISNRNSRGARSFLCCSSDLALQDSDVLGASFIESFDTESDDDEFAELFVKDKNISTMLLSRDLEASWGEANRALFLQAKIIAGALQSAGGIRPWVIVVSSQTLGVLQGVFVTPPTTSIAQLNALLVRLVSALTAAVPLLSAAVNVSYVPTSGVASLLRS